MIKRYILLTIGLFIMAMGVALTKVAEMGVSPISSVANVMNYIIPSISLGTWLIIWNCVLIIGQIAILRRNFKLYQLLQLPLSFAFGWFTDLGMWIVSSLPTDNIYVRFALILAGTVVLGFGVALTVIADLLMNSGEAFVKAVADKIHKKFGDVKIGFDIFCVVISVLISLICFNMKIVGTGMGTLISALLTGKIVNFFIKHLKKRVVM